MLQNENISTHEKVAQVLTMVQAAASTGDLASVRPKLSEFAEGVRAGIQPFYSAYQHPGLDPGLAMVGYQIMEPLMQLLQVVDDLLGEKITAGAALPQLHELAQQLVEADVALREAELATDLLPCYNCGHDNERETTNCVECGEELQDLPRDADYIVLPDDYWILYEACEQVAQEHEHLGEWRKQVNAMAAEFTNTRQRIESADRDLGSEVDAEALLKALDEALSALQEMRAFEGDRDPEHLNQGWMRLLDAAKKVQDTGGQLFQTLEAKPPSNPD
jgi:Zn ribbon nucleic-acid-binding protein